MNLEARGSSALGRATLSEAPSAVAGRSRVCGVGQHWASAMARTMAASWWGSKPCVTRTGEMGRVLRMGSAPGVS
jgi:hypothetical protein